MTAEEIDALSGLFVEQVQDLFVAEYQLIDALPRMAEVAKSSELRSAIETHFTETRGHIDRLEAVFQYLAIYQDPIDGNGHLSDSGEVSRLFQETTALAEAEPDPRARDVALVAAAESFEQFEVASYGIACSLAEKLGLTEVAGLLSLTLNEERRAMLNFMDLAETFGNSQMHPASDY